MRENSLLRRIQIRQRLRDAFRRFLDLEAAGGLVLLVCAAIAIVWASIWPEQYEQFWRLPLGFAVESIVVRPPIRLWINDLLMSLFFLVVGMEIKREFLFGDLAGFRRALLPIAAAVGGVIVPAILFLSLNREPSSARGWGIPIATDIAFSLAVLALLGSRIPPALKVFLAAFAIVDDLLAVVVLAVFYSAELDILAIKLAAIPLLVCIVSGWRKIESPLLYALCGVAMWMLFMKAGVHPTVAAVLLAMTIPMNLDADESGQQQNRRSHFEERLHAVSTFFVIPLFGLANAGVVLSEVPGTLTSNLALGIVLALIVGKPVGILLFSWLAVTGKVARLPRDVPWSGLVGVAILGGIGFTMSLFVADLAYNDEIQLAIAKSGIVLGSVVSGVLGMVWLSRVFKRQADMGELTEPKQ